MNERPHRPFPLAQLNPLWIREGAPREFTGAIFDLDGTLLDSMAYWESLAERYLAARGETPTQETSEAIARLTLEEAASYLKSTYRLPEPECEIFRSIMECIAEPYRSHIELKPGVAHMLKTLDGAGVALCAATASDKELVMPALERLNILRFFRDVFTCPEVGASKSRPDVFEWALRELGTPRKSTFVFEDSLHAIETAKRAGFPVIAVADPVARADAPAIEKVADAYIETFAAMAQ